MNSTGGQRKLYSEALHNFYTSSNIVRMIKLRRMRIGWAWSMHESDEKCKQNVGPEASREEKSHLENLAIDEMIILEWLLKK